MMWEVSLVCYFHAARAAVLPLYLLTIFWEPRQAANFFMRNSAAQLQNVFILALLPSSANSSYGTEIMHNAPAGTVTIILAHQWMCSCRLYRACTAPAQVLSSMARKNCLVALEQVREVSPQLHFCISKGFEGWLMKPHFSTTFLSTLEPFLTLG
eukprot:1156437-Pelagomonas_calceolata.AAC.19